MQQTAVANHSKWPPVYQNVATSQILGYQLELGRPKLVQLMLYTQSRNWFLLRFYCVTKSEARKPKEGDECVDVVRHSVPLFITCHLWY